jgi:hypothetical protein
MPTLDGMATTLPFWLGTEPSDWTTGVAVGIVVTLVGALVFFSSGGLQPPSGGIAFGSYLLLLFVIGLGAATVVGSLAIYRWRRATDPAE